MKGYYPPMTGLKISFKYLQYSGFQSKCEYIPDEIMHVIEKNIWDFILEMAF